MRQSRHGTALGIGANTAIFSVVNGVLPQPLEYQDPSRIVAVGNAWKDRKISGSQMSEPDFDDLHDQSTVFDGLACSLADARLAETVASPRFRGTLLGIFAALAVCLAMAGVYGVMACLVTQRASEFGLRMALGADRARIVRLVLGSGARLAGAGLAAGFLGALAATRLLRTIAVRSRDHGPAHVRDHGRWCGLDRLTGVRDSRLASHCGGPLDRSLRQE